MTNDELRIRDNSDDRKYYVQTPQIVWAACDSPYEYVLWDVIKMIAAEDGECFLMTQDLARMAMMSVGKVNECRKTLIAKGLLNGKKVSYNGRSIWHLEIPNLWRKNAEWREDNHSLKERIRLKCPRSKTQEEQNREAVNSLEVLMNSPGEFTIAPGETKKNQEEEPKEDTSKNQSQMQTPPPKQQDSSLADFEHLFGPVKVPERVHHTPEEIMASTKRASARGWANRASSGETTHPAFEKELEKYGDDAPALRELHKQIEAGFGLAPNWGSVSKVKEWTNGLSELYAAARGDISIAIAAAKKLRNDGMTMATPHSIVVTAQSIAAERATAYTAPSARAVREYV